VFPTKPHLGASLAGAIGDDFIVDNFAVHLPPAAMVVVAAAFLLW